MIKHPFNDDKRLTANQFAKWLVWDRGSVAGYDLADQSGLENATEKELDDIYAAIEKHIQRAHEFFGIGKFIDLD